MALIDCPECGKSISDRAPACPGCGFPVAQAQGRPTHHQAALPGEQWAGGDVALKGIKDTVALFNIVWGANAAAWMVMVGVVKCLTGDWDMGGGILLVFVPFAFIVAGILGIATSRTQKPTFGQKSKRYWTFLVLIAISSIIANIAIGARASNMGCQYGQSSRAPSQSESERDRTPGQPGRDTEQSPETTDFRALIDRFGAASDALLEAKYADLHDQNKDRFAFTKGLMQGVARTQGMMHGAAGIAKSVTGNKIGAQSSYMRVGHRLRRAEAYAAPVQQFWSKDSETGAFGSIGNLGSWAASTAGQLIPTSTGRT